MAQTARLRLVRPARAEEGRAAQEPLWREALGRRLRALRREREQTLAATAGRAGISPQYLSEIERGRKEPSSEMIAALAGALGTTLGALTEQVAVDLRRAAVSRADVPQASLQRADVAVPLVPQAPHGSPISPEALAA